MPRTVSSTTPRRRVDSSRLLWLLAILAGLALLITACEADPDEEVADTDDPADEEPGEDVEADEAEEGDEGDEADEADEPADDAEVELQFSYINDWQHTQELVDAYMEENPNVQITTTYAPTDEYQATTRTQLSSGTGPDVFTVWPGDGNPMALNEIAPAGYLADLSDESWVGQAPEPIQRVSEYEGQTHIMVPAQGVIGVVYNTAIFDDLGLDVPETWSEFVEVAEAIDEEGLAPIGLGNATDWQTQLLLYALVPSTVYADNPEFNEDRREGAVSFADSGWAEAMEMYTSLEEQGLFQDDPLGTTYEEVLQLLADGEAAMSVQVSAALGGVVEAGGNEDDFAIFPLPGAEDPGDVWIPAASSVGAAVNADSEHVDVARDLVAYMAEEENVQELAAGVDEIPVVGAEEATPDALELMVPAIDEGRSAPYPDQFWPSAEVQQEMFVGVEQVFAGQATIEEMLQSMDDVYDASLD